MIELPVVRDETAICSIECGALCCRSKRAQPICRTSEMRVLKGIAESRGVKAKFLNVGPNRWLLQYASDGCPFLGQDTNLCTVYEDRPGICRSFPYMEFQDCLLRPGGEDAPRIAE